jgi:aminoglycoside phosphotransferase family enzyme/predicted kinase
VPREKSRRTAAEEQSLATALTNPACYDHDVGKVSVAETHISWVFLTGRYAYKVKKPVKLPFLDFSTLRKRHHFCLEELRLNRRLAPELYLGVVPIGGSRAAPHVGRRPAFEYAVKMEQFGPDARLDEKLRAKAVPRTAILDFAEALAEFHDGLTPVHGDPTGRAARVAALDNFAVLEPITIGATRQDLSTLRSWTEREAASLEGVFAQRSAAGAQRECHGDLHLENLLLRNGGVVAYDALEFDRALREIDVVSEASFLAMDLIAHGRPDLAYDFVNRYLEVSGDYGGLDVLRFYLVYRALVRAKVRAIKAAQARRTTDERPYLETALELIRHRPPLLLITHGLSGSGKTTVTDELVGPLRALRVRSDLERKRLYGLSTRARTGTAVGQGLYAAGATALTYERLATIADRALRHGFNAIVDATFLRRRERTAFRQVAAANAARFAILDCTAPAEELRRRITTRFAAARDASEATLAVLEHQLAGHEPLDRAELRSAVRVDTGRKVRYSALLAALAQS